MAKELTQQRRASDYAGEIELTSLAEQGFGAGFERSLLEAGFARARGNLEHSRVQRNQALSRSGLDFSGVHEVKLPAMEAGQFASDVFQSHLSARQEQQRVKQFYQQMLMGHLQSEDRMAFEREKFKLENQRDWLDYAGIALSFI